jgi:predicted membrane channel-forming protein YqfA (hemolysin III family)
MMALTIVGALFGSFVLSRMLLFFTKRWTRGSIRFLIVHGSLVLVYFATIMFDQNIVRHEIEQAYLYSAAQVLWLLVDLFVHRGRSESQRGVA